MKRYILLFSFLLCWTIGQTHPLKMSVTDIVYKDNKLYLKFKLFTDDLEMTLRTFCNISTIDLVNIGFDKAATDCLQKHIGQNFSVKWNGKPVPLKFKKVSLNETKEVSYVEMESTTLVKGNPSTIFVLNTLMFKNLPEQ